MDIKELKSLIKMVTESDIAELELESADEKIRIKRGGNPEVVHYQVAASSPAVPISAQVMAAATAVPAENQKTSAAVPDKGQIVNSPIVGTFYRAPAPDAPPYVEVGQTVEKGQILCIVEAMKLMNEIEAEYRCKVLQICKENAQPVEFGDALFVVEPL